MLHNASPLVPSQNFWGNAAPILQAAFARVVDCNVPVQRGRTMRGNHWLPPVLPVLKMPCGQKPPMALALQSLRRTTCASVSQLQ